MTPEDRLSEGMSIEDACIALPGWRFQRVYSPADPSRYHTWEFSSPEFPGILLRLTFDDRRLLVWGRPAQSNPQTAPSPQYPTDA